MLYRVLKNILRVDLTLGVLASIKKIFKNLLRSEIGFILILCVCVCVLNLLIFVSRTVKCTARENTVI